MYYINGIGVISMSKKIKYSRIIFSITLLLAISLEASAISAAERTVPGANEDSVTAAAGSVSSDVISGDTGLHIAKPEIQAIELPVIYKKSLEILYKDRHKEKETLASSLKSLLSEDMEQEAAKTLGAAFGRRQKSSAAYLGYYCAGILAYIGKDVEDQARFLSGFVSGYGGGTGVLMFTKEGIQSFRVSGKRRGPMWRTVKDPYVPGDKLSRIYQGKSAVFIPFSTGEIFTVDLYGKPGGTVKMWKILPNGINTKSWPGGQWEREVTVRGG